MVWENSGAIAVLISPAALASTGSRKSTRLLSLIPKSLHTRCALFRHDSEGQRPGFLSTRRRVDFQDESLFDNKIDELIRGISREASIPTKLLSQESTDNSSQNSAFSGFFQKACSEALLSSDFENESGVVDGEAKRSGLTCAINLDGLELMGADPERIFELGQHVTDKSKTVGELLSAIDEWIAEDHPFDHYIELGIGRALLMLTSSHLFNTCRPKRKQTGKA